MKKTILITGATDGIGLETAKRLAAEGHQLLLHGRNREKLEATKRTVTTCGAGTVETYVADLSVLDDVRDLAKAISAKHDRLDVLINNAGVYRVAQTTTENGQDVRYVVNTVAPYLLTQLLLPLMAEDSRVVNLSSAAQAPVEIAALAGRKRVTDMEAYAQSKLALTMWSRQMGDEKGPVVIAVNPGSLLATKMVKEGFGVAGSDIGIGAEVLVHAALSETFADASGRYFDNDARRFSDPHLDALDPAKVEAVVGVISELAKV